MTVRPRSASASARLPAQVVFPSPAGVGVIQYGGLLKAQALALALALVGSTALTLAVTVLVFVGVSRLMGHRAADEAPDNRGDAA